jgi:hypothetical protein
MYGFFGFSRLIYINKVMIANLFKIAAVLLVLAGGVISCRDKMNDETDGLSLEISPDSKLQFIEKELNGITFKFCMLNEQRQPATVFHEGENFSFYTLRGQFL